jgi:DNA-binding PadR family transcriptional regulator
VSATRLLVLGVVRMYGTAHGYQVRRELLTWSADRWANVAPGSIYHALKKMTTEQLLEVSSTDAQSSGPDRTAYRLTPDGESEFQLLLAKYLADSDDSAQGSYRLAAAVTFLPALPRATALSLLKHRLTQVAGNRATAQGMLDNGTGWGQPEHVEELYHLWVNGLNAQEEWLQGVISRLESGRYSMADDEGTIFGPPPPPTPR